MLRTAPVSYSKHKIKTFFIHCYIFSAYDSAQHIDRETEACGGYVTRMSPSWSSSVHGWLQNHPLHHRIILHPPHPLAFSYNRGLLKCCWNRLLKYHEPPNFRPFSDAVPLAWNTLFSSKYPLPHPNFLSVQSVPFLCWIFMASQLPIKLTGTEHILSCIVTCLFCVPCFSSKTINPLKMDSVCLMVLCVPGRD